MATDDHTLFEAMAALAMQRLRTERCVHAVASTIKLDCEECLEELIAECLMKIALAAANGHGK